MTTKANRSLAGIYQQLALNARRTGTRRALTLGSGARIGVDVAEGVVTLHLGRKGAPVGDKEIATFRAHCRVPETATREPAEGQDRHGDWYVVRFVWQEGGV